MTTKLIVILICLFSVLASVSADPSIEPSAADPALYPSVAALHAASIPVRDRVDLARRLFGVTDYPALPTSAPTYSVGDVETFYASNSNTGADFTVQARLRSIGEHIALWVEEGASLSDADIQSLVDAFDQRVYPNVTAMWGSEANPGIDGDPRVHGLFASGLGDTTAAYFASDHTYPREVFPTSNAREMFFFNIDALPVPFSLPYVESVVAHEFQHMIRNNVQLNEDTWMNEGMSTFTQVHLYNYVDPFMLSFLNKPETQLTDWNTIPELRAANYGGAALFLTYLNDRFGEAAMHDLSLDQSARAWGSVDTVVREYGAESANTVFADWALVNLLHSLELPGQVTLNGDVVSGSDGVNPYHYASLPPLLTPPTAGEFGGLTGSFNGSVAPYATNYFALRYVNGIPAFNINLNTDGDAPLIPATVDGQAAYSNRADLSDMRLTQQFDLSNVSTASLDYQVWYDFETGWDYGYLMASRDGITWETLSTNGTTPHDPVDNTYGAGYTGESNGWLNESASLDAYVGGQVYLRFEAITDDAVNRPGMMIDNVRIDALGYAENFDEGLGAWESEGWIATDNRLPATFYVQAVTIGDSGVNISRWETQGDAGWTLPLSSDARQVWLAISPVVPVTTVPLAYSLSVQS